jgi:long-subunit fatty acid transport protein
MYWESATTNQLAFLGAIGLQAKYQFTQRLLLKAAYEAIWLKGVALAPGQILKTFSNGDPQNTYVQALGVDSGAGVFFQGATAGLEYAFWKLRRGTRPRPDQRL